MGQAGTTHTRISAQNSGRMNEWKDESKKRMEDGKKKVDHYFSLTHTKKY